MAEKNTVQIAPGPVPLEELAKALIGLADHPHDVVWQSRGGYFDVPEEVAVRYAKEQGAAANEEADGTPAAKPRARRRAASTRAKAAAADTTAEPAAPRARASRSTKTATDKTEPKARARSSRSKKKGGDS